MTSTRPFHPPGSEGEEAEESYSRALDEVQAVVREQHSSLMARQSNEEEEGPADLPDVRRAAASGPLTLRSSLSRVSILTCCSSTSPSTSSSLPPQSSSPLLLPEPLAFKLLEANLKHRIIRRNLSGPVASRVPSPPALYAPLEATSATPFTPPFTVILKAGSPSFSR